MRRKRDGELFVPFALQHFKVCLLGSKFSVHSSAESHRTICGRNCCGRGNRNRHNIHQCHRGRQIQTSASQATPLSYAPIENPSFCSVNLCEHKNGWAITSILLIPHVTISLILINAHHWFIIIVTVSAHLPASMYVTSRLCYLLRMRCT